MTDALLRFLAFALVASATPGPNNIMAMTTAATRGLARTVPMILGVAIGFGFMVAVVGCGLAAPLARYPHLHTAMRWIGIAWLLVLAWQIASAPGLTAPPPGADARSSRPALGFRGACAFQWINPKAWIMAMAAAATYGLPGLDPILQSLARAALFILVGLLTVTSWALLGLGLGRTLPTRSNMRIFNIAMGLLLAASALPAALE